MSIELRYFDEKFQTYKVAWELEKLEKSAKSFTKECIEFYKDLTSKNESLLAKNLKKT